MSGLTADAVRQAWVTRVRVLTGDSSYHADGLYNGKWNALFARVADVLNRNNIPLVRFVDTQIRWVIGRNKPATMWPSVLSGAEAMRRYYSQPNDEDELDQLREYYQAQAEAFARVCTTVGEDVALENNVLQQSPLFLAFIYHKTGKTAPEGLLHCASLELRERPAAASLFPTELVKKLEALC